jgi:hypothetical protein
MNMQTGPPQQNDGWFVSWHMFSQSSSVGGSPGQSVADVLDPPLPPLPPDPPLPPEPPPPEQRSMLQTSLPMISQPQWPPLR